MLPWVITALFAFAFGGFAWYFVSGVKIKAGWQNGQSPLARYLDAKRRAKFNMQLPEALATMSNALRAGFSISQAFDSVVAQGEAPMREEFAILQQQLKVGMSFDAALESFVNQSETWRRLLADFRPAAKAAAERAESESPSFGATGFLQV